MISLPKLPGMEKDKNPSSSRVSPPRDADAHAMNTLLNSKEINKGQIDELSSLFSSQSRQASIASRDLKTTPADKDIEQRLKQYQDAKNLTKEEPGQEKSGQENPGKNPGEQEHGEYECPDELAREVAEHILVSDKAHMDSGSPDEVRIKIKDSILKDAHVHMVREPDCLQVKLISSDKQSITTLIEARTDLEKQLEKNYKGLIRIEIVHIKQKGEI